MDQLTEIRNDIRDVMDRFQYVTDEDELASMQRSLDHLLWREEQWLARYDY